MIEVRPTRSDEWQLLKETRLAALADSPDSYSATLANESALPEDAWQQRATPTARSANFTAVEGGVWLGMGALLGDEGSESGQLVAVWVNPAHRGRGVGAALVAAITSWCQDRGHQRIRLWVNEANQAAIRLYEQGGFRRTGERKPLPNHPGHMEIAMSRAINGDK